LHHDAYRNKYARKVNLKPLVLSIMAIVVLIATVGVALAWTDMTQAKTNKFHGSVDADVTLHDEFDGVDKDVFVENSGTATIFVRVRLDEYAQSGDLIFASGAKVKDKTTWTPHTYDGVSITDCGNADNGKFHEYYRWTMNGGERDYTPGTPGMVYTVLSGSGKVDRTDLTGEGHHTAAASAPVKLSEAIAALNAVEPDAAQQGIITAVNAGVWLLDDTDTAENGGGWAYWSKPLLPETATNLLLTKVELLQDFPDDWIYRIDVKLQAVTANDFAKWNAGDWFGYRTTAGAESLIHLWQTPAAG
jgi:hypothetical protein